MAILCGMHQQGGWAAPGHPALSHENPRHFPSRFFCLCYELPPKPDDKLLLQLAVSYSFMFHAQHSAL